MAAAVIILVSDLIYALFFVDGLNHDERVLVRAILTTAQLALVLWPTWPLLKLRRYFLDFDFRSIPIIDSNLKSPFLELQSMLNAIRGIEYKNIELDRLRELRTKEQNQFFANASHEMRTPMTTMIGWLDLLGENALGPNTPEQLEAIKTVQNALNRLMVTVNNTIDISKIEVGRMNIDKTLFPVGEELEMLRMQFLPMVKNKSLNFSVEAEENLPLVWADQDKFRQVMTNLVSNAVKYTPEGGTITVKAKACPNDAECVAFCVSDTGVGIPKSSMEEGKLFSKFYQVRVKDARVGSGLGLAIVKELVTMMDGTIAVDSKVGEGSTFTVMLPGKTDAE